MTTTLEKTSRPGGTAPTGRLFDPGAERSLDDVVTTVWGSVALRGSARCLVCGETLGRAGEERIAARCTRCGSTLD